MRMISALDGAWLLVESRDTPMHVGALLELTLPEDAPPDYLRRQLARMRAQRQLAAPWNLRPVEAPLLGARLPLMREVRDVDLDYHVRHSALPNPGSQRELGILVSRIHGNPLDFHRPLWEVHVIEGLEGNRWAMYAKIHHSLIDGVSGMRLILKALSTSADDPDTPPIWTVGPRRRRRPRSTADDAASSRTAPTPARRPGAALARTGRQARGGLRALRGLTGAAGELTRAAFSDGALQAPFRAPASALGGTIGGSRRFATQQYDLEQLKELARAGGCTVNDVCLYLCGTALRRYLNEHAQLPRRSLTVGFPVSLRSADDDRVGTAIGTLVADLATNVGDPLERLEAIRASTAAAKEHLQAMPPEALSSQTVVVNGPFILGLVAGLKGRTPRPFNMLLSNVPGPAEPLYFAGSRLDAIFPVSLVFHGAALNVTCISYAGTMNFGLIGARDTLPHLQRLAVYLGEALEELTGILLGQGASAGR